MNKVQSHQKTYTGSYWPMGGRGRVSYRKVYMENKAIQIGLKTATQCPRSKITSEINLGVPWAHTPGDAQKAN